jgi:pyruvate/2-oxoglutarate dehydrogenase complex dihydrolipoamide dehydrogenase (E3) component
LTIWFSNRRAAQPRLDFNAVKTRSLPKSENFRDGDPQLSKAKAVDGIRTQAEFQAKRQYSISGSQDNLEGSKTLADRAICTT